MLIFFNSLRRASGIYFLLAISLCGLSGCPSAPSALVVYCAHDAMFSQQVLEDFERETGIAVSVRFDTEATKSTGLTNLIIREKNAPRCDVYWNNETFGTIDLVRRGLTEPYQGPGWRRIPEQYKDPDGHWTGFGGRLRVWIINTDLMEPIESVVDKAFENRLEEFTYAKPLFGTTLTHFCALQEELGEAAFHALDQRLRETATVANGNGKTRDLVAAGTCAFGWTDTDDYFGAVDSQKPVAMLPVRIADKTICIPNSVAIIRGTSRRADAEKLVDYLLSKEIELRLARSEARQVPLGDIGDDELPEEVQALVEPAQQGMNLSTAAKLRQPVLEYLTNAYAP